MDNDFKIALPPRIKEDIVGSSLSEADFEMLDAFILSPLKFSDVWLKYKGIKGTKTHARAVANEFYSLHDVQSYLEKRKRQLLGWMSPQPTKEGGKVSKEITKDDIDEIKFLMVQAAKDTNNVAHFDALKAVFSKVADTMKLGDDIEPPRRYLPVTCSICPYKIFVEKEAVDMCKLCKYKHFANDNGIVYEKQNQLEK